jgi:hypothetical protein
MAVTYAQLIRANPGEYAAAGRTLLRLSTRLQESLDRLNTCGQQLSTKARWQGQARQSAGHHNVLCFTDLHEINGAVTTAADALAFAAEGIQPAAAAAKETGLEAETTGFQVTALGEVLVTPMQYAEADAAGPEAAPELIAVLELDAATLTGIIETAVGEATAADSAAAEALGIAITPLRAVQERPLHLEGVPDGPRLTWAPSDKHGTIQRGRAAPAPSNPQQVLNTSVPLGPDTSRRVGVDPETGEYCVFDETHNGQLIFHGHVRPWTSTDPRQPALTPDMKNALVRAGLTDLNGRILT